MQGGDAHAYAAAMPPMPQISEMLLREANAWNALLQLNGNVSAAAHGLSSHDDSLEFDEQRETAAQREASYVGALSNLAALCDALAQETLKLRSLRKARHQVASMALQQVMRDHANGALALGEGHARRTALDVTNATAAVRAQQQDARSQLAQARSLLQAMQECRALALPAGARVVIGVEHASDGAISVRPVEEVLGAAYANGGHMTEASLAAALYGDVPAAAKAPAATTFRRRGGSSAPPDGPAEPPAEALTDDAEPDTPTAAPGDDLRREDGGGEERGAAGEGGGEAAAGSPD